MHRNKFNTNYRAICPEISSEVENFLRKSDRQMEYQYYERKRPKIWVGYKRLSFEDSLDRLTEIGEQFVSSENVEEKVINSIIYAQAIAEIKLIKGKDGIIMRMIYLEDKSERDVAKAVGMSQPAVRKRRMNAEKYIARKIKIKKF